MSFNLSNIKWGWVLLGVVVALLIAYGSAICVVSGYAGYLGFEAQGVPDQAAINAFADTYAGGISSLFIIVGTLVGGLIAGRKAEADAVQNGLLVGIIAAVIDLVLGLSGGLAGLTLWSLVSIILAIAGGWLAEHSPEIKNIQFTVIGIQQAANSKYYLALSRVLYSDL